ncbi:MAG: alpha/beta hydrolase [Candidatus Omnitrophica bacterium]|nr:alpha/beta hydrolase [Candidatus Omnitrophota bacterium]MCM8830953.1 alpha/beta hydrolase [Candidatus Omnitrophota bacterium]
MPLPTNFKYIDRGFAETIVLIYGWATDYRIFCNINLKYNYIFPLKLSPFDFSKALLDFLDKNNFRKVALLGWSLGGFVVAEFASKFPQLISKLILISIQESYEISELERVRSYIIKNKEAYLYKFYNNCFFDKKSTSLFKKTLLKDYLQKFSSKILCEGLEYLKIAKINPKDLDKINDITIIHGKEDKIVSYKKAISVNEALNKSKIFLLDDAGHIPFFEKDISKLIC